MLVCGRVLRPAPALLLGVVLAGCGARTGLDVAQSRAGNAGSSARGSGGRPAAGVPSCRFAFLPPLVLTAGEGPQSIAAGDLDGDQALDLVVANTNSDRLSSLLNTGGRTFSDPTPLSVAQPTALSVADLDGDQRPELIVANGNLCTLSVLSNAGSGQFQSPVAYASGCYIQGLVTVDLDHDGAIDVASADNTSATLSVYLNRERGQLAQVPYDFGSRPTSIATGDLDGDGFSDLVATSWGFLPARDSSPIIGVFRNSGAGGFELRERFDVGGAPKVVTTGDFDGDGSVDLAVGYDFDTTLRVYPGRGGGGFEKPVKYAVGTSPAALGAADFDGDGRLDLVTADHGSSELSFLRGGKAGELEPREAYPAVALPTSLALGDFDADGWLDVAVAGFEAGQVGVFFGDCR